MEGESRDSPYRGRSPERQVPATSSRSSYPQGRDYGGSLRDRNQPGDERKVRRTLQWGCLDEAAMLKNPERYESKTGWESGRSCNPNGAVLSLQRA